MMFPELGKDIEPKKTHRTAERLWHRDLFFGREAIDEESLGEFRRLSQFLNQKAANLFEHKAPTNPKIKIIEGRHIGGTDSYSIGREVKTVGGYKHVINNMVLYWDQLLWRMAFQEDLSLNGKLTTVQIRHLGHTLTIFPIVLNSQ